MVPPGMMPAVGMMPGVGMNGRADFLGGMHQHQPPVQQQHAAALPMGAQQQAQQQPQPWRTTSMSMPSGMLPGASTGLTSMGAAAPTGMAPNGSFSMPIQQGESAPLLPA
jgi:hypothetical protein